MRADFLLLQKLMKINEDKDDQKSTSDPESKDEDGSDEKDQSIVDKVKEKKKKEDDKESPLQKELKNTCKCPNCGYIGSSKEFTVELVNSGDE